MSENDQVRRLVATFDFGGWEVRTNGGVSLIVVADGLGQDQDPYLFDSLYDIRGQRREMQMATISSGDVSRVSSTDQAPLERPKSWVHPAILSDPIPTWRIGLRDGVNMTIAADAFRPVGKWTEFYFRVEQEGEEWDEPVLFVRYNDLKSATVGLR